MAKNGKAETVNVAHLSPEEITVLLPLNSDWHDFFSHANQSDLDWLERVGASLKQAQKKEIIKE
jgi:hypothetical protein